MNTAQSTKLTVAESVAVLQAGGVLAYPTEAVYGLGCDPWNEEAVAQVRRLKGRAADQGLIALAADAGQVRPWVECDALAWRRAERSWPGPVTWVFAAAAAPAWLCAPDGSIAIRVTAHPPAARLASAFGAPLVSTSANPGGRRPARGEAELRRYFGERVPIMDGALGDSVRPSQIRDARSGRVLRD